MEEQKTLTIENFVSPMKGYIAEQLDALDDAATEVEVLQALYGTPTATGTNEGEGADATYPATYTISGTSQTFTVTAAADTTVTSISFTDPTITVSGLVATIPAKYHKPLVFSYTSTAL